MDASWRRTTSSKLRNRLCAAAGAEERCEQVGRGPQRGTQRCASQPAGRTSSLMPLWACRAADPARRACCPAPPGPCLIHRQVCRVQLVVAALQLLDARVHQLRDGLVDQPHGGAHGLAQLHQLPRRKRRGGAGRRRTCRKVGGTSKGDVPRQPCASEPARRGPGHRPGAGRHASRVHRPACRPIGQHLAAPLATTPGPRLCTPLHASTLACNWNEHTPEPRNPHPLRPPPPKTQTHTQPLPPPGGAGPPGRAASAPGSGATGKGDARTAPSSPSQPAHAAARAALAVPPGEHSVASMWRRLCCCESICSVDKNNSQPGQHLLPMQTLTAHWQSRAAAHDSSTTACTASLASNPKGARAEAEGRRAAPLPRWH